jgi:ketosteroid isomerase-like protein
MARRRSEKAKNPERGQAPVPGLLRRDGSPPAAELAEDADVVRAMYRAIEEGDLEAFSRFADPDIGWIDPVVSRLPYDGTRRGVPSVLRAAFRHREDGTGPRPSAATFVELGDGVLVAGRFLADTGAEPFLHECSVRGGRVFCVRGYPA